MKKGVIILIVVAVVVLGIFMWVKSTYNGLVTKQESVESAWSQVENVYQRRADLVPNLGKRSLKSHSNVNRPY